MSLSSILGYLTPTWAHMLLTGSTLSVVLVVAVLFFTGGSAAVSGFFKMAFQLLQDALEPAFKALGAAIVILMGWIWDALGITWRNPEVLSLLATVFLSTLCWYYVPLRIELASTKAELAQYKSGARSKPPATSKPSISTQAKSVVKNVEDLFKKPLG